MPRNARKMQAELPVLIALCVFPPLIRPSDCGSWGEGRAYIYIDTHIHVKCKVLRIYEYIHYTHIYIYIEATEHLEELRPTSCTAHPPPGGC